MDRVKRLRLPGARALVPHAHAHRLRARPRRDELLAARPPSVKKAPPFPVKPEGVREGGEQFHERVCPSHAHSTIGNCCSFLNGRCSPLADNPRPPPRPSRARDPAKALVRAVGGDESACTPDSVRTPGRPWRPSISAGGCPPAPAAYPGVDGRAALSLLGLAPGGVCRAARVAPGAGALLPHRFTLACAGRPAIGGLLSVALSCGSPRLGVTQHPALWSPDVPRPGHRSPSDRARTRPPGRLVTAHQCRARRRRVDLFATALAALAKPVGYCRGREGLARGKGAGPAVRTLRDPGSRGDPLGGDTVLARGRWSVSVRCAPYDPEWDAFVGASHGYYSQLSAWARVRALSGWRARRIVVARRGDVLGGAQLSAPPGLGARKPRLRASRPGGRRLATTRRRISSSRRCCASRARSACVISRFSPPPVTPSSKRGSAPPAFVRIPGSAATRRPYVSTCAGICPSCSRGCASRRGPTCDGP
ncbi:MAG: hypothetical protein KatS3mg010_0952 [Acidimicrobiia bacterium]|nr:MAG: hypothetical protein KatS3mg010_0952 [Acidimicrobiia bacterium]